MIVRQATRHSHNLEGREWKEREREGVEEEEKKKKKENEGKCAGCTEI